MPVSLRLIRIAKMAALIADIWTIVYIVLVGIWHLEGFSKTGQWPVLPLSSFIFKPEHKHSGMDITGSIGGANHLNALLQVPIILILILAAVLLTIFYLWLRDIEKRISEN